MPTEHTEDEGTVGELKYYPLEMISLETSHIVMADGMNFIHILYTDRGGEKPLWFLPDVAIEFGNEIARLGRGAKMTQGATKGGIEIAREIPRGLNNGSPFKG